MPPESYDFYFDDPSQDPFGITGGEPGWETRNPSAIPGLEQAIQQQAQQEAMDWTGSLDLAPTATTGAAEPGLFSGIKAGGAQSIPGVAAAAYGLYQGKNFLDGKKLDPLAKVALALPTGGLSLFSDSLQDAFGLGPKTNIEESKWQDLLDSTPGLAELIGPQAVKNVTTDRTEAAIDYKLPGGFIGLHPETNNWVNNAFGNTRDEGYLKPEDIMLYEDLVTSIDPKLYFGTTPENRVALATSALGTGGVREHHGTIDLDETAKSAVQAKARELGIINDTPA